MSQEPDHYIRDIRQCGIICYQELYNAEKHYAFAWQIYSNKQLFTRFDPKDAQLIETNALLELKDSWYQEAGEQLIAVGYEAFVGEMLETSS